VANAVRSWHPPEEQIRIGNVWSLKLTERDQRNPKLA
jgi:hypothetical protein